MEEIDPLAPDIQWNAKLFTDGVGPDGFRNRPEVFAELVHHAGILGATEEHVVRLGIKPRQVPQQVTDVGADAVIAQLAGVDGDSQDTRFYRGSWPFMRR